MLDAAHIQQEAIKQMPLLALFDSARWSKKRAENIRAARKCKHTLTDSQGIWKLDPNEKRVKDAVGYWVYRAKTCHAYAMGRKGITDNMVIISHNKIIAGKDVRL